jgi:hypothetical protein
VPQTRAKRQNEGDDSSADQSLFDTAQRRYQLDDGAIVEVPEIEEEALSEPADAPETNHQESWAESLAKTVSQPSLNASD